MTSHKKPSSSTSHRAIGELLFGENWENEISELRERIKQAGNTDFYHAEDVRRACADILPKPKRQSGILSTLESHLDTLRKKGVSEESIAKFEMWLNSDKDKPC